MTKVKKTKSKKSEKEAPAGDGAAPARSTSKKRAQRSGSNVFAMFTQHQVAQFKEAFGFIDSDKDGIISKNDIRATFDALGRLCTDKELEEMASEAPVSVPSKFFPSPSSSKLTKHSISLGTNQLYHIFNHFR